MRRRIVLSILFVAPLFFTSASLAQSGSPRDKRALSDRRDGGAQQQGPHDDDKCDKAEHEKASRNEKHLRNDDDRRHDADDWRKNRGHHDNGDKCAPAPAPQPPPAVGVAQIQGTIFNDANGSGVVDAGEAGLSGWTVSISGPVQASLSTDASGAYSFTALPVGTYLVCVTPSAGWSETSPSSASGTACPTGLGWSVDVPITIPDLWYTGIDFMFKAP